MADLNIRDRVKLWELRESNFARQFEQVLGEVFFPGRKVEMEGIVRGVLLKGPIFYKDLTQYELNTQVSQAEAVAIAVEFLKSSLASLDQATKSGFLPIEFQTLLTGLKPRRPEPVYLPSDDQTIHFWQVMFEPFLEGGEYIQQDEKWRINRYKSLVGGISGAWMRLDVGGSGEVMGMIIQRPLLSQLYEKSIPSKVPAEEDPKVHFHSHQNSNTLYPYLASAEKGLVPLFQPQKNIIDEWGQNLNAYGITQAALENNTRRFRSVGLLMGLEDEESLPFDEGDKLKVFRDDIGFHSYDVGYVPDGEKPPADSFIYPSLFKGEVLTFHHQTPSGWLYVTRETNGSKGYVDWRYVELDITTKNLPEIVIWGLTEAGAEKMANSLCGLITLHEEPDFSFSGLMQGLENILNPFQNPPLIPPQEPLFPTKEVERVPLQVMMTILRDAFRRYDIEDFALLCIKLREAGCLHKILAVAEKEDILKEYQVYLCMAFMLPLADFIEILEGLLGDEVLDLIWQERKLLLRKPTWRNPIPIGVNKDEIKNRIGEVLDEVLESEEEIAQATEENLSYFLRMKFYELNYYFNHGDQPQINRMVIEMDSLADMGLEILFSEDPQSPFLQLPKGYTIVDVWNFMKKNPGVPNMYLIKEGDSWHDYGKREANPLSDIFCNRTATLMTDLPTPKGPLPESLDEQELKAYAAALAACKGVPSPTPSPSSNAAPSPINSQGGKSFVKRMVLLVGVRIRDFILSDLYASYVSNPQFLPEINRVIHDHLQPAAAKKLNVSRRYQRLFGNRKLAEEKLTAGKINADAELIDKFTWMDLARIWYYELGSQKRMGQESNELKFGKNSLTTQMLREHPSLQVIRMYVRARILAGNCDPLRIFVHYDVNGFWKAVAANDVTFNLLGSFSVDIEIDPTKQEASFEVRNDLSMESATRFIKGDNKKGRATNEGIVENHERDDASHLDMGGTLRCIWSWTEQD